MTFKEQNQLMSEAARGAATQDLIPPYADSKGMTRLCGLSRSHLYALAAEGKIVGISLRKTGGTKGRRLWDVRSVLAFLESCAIPAPSSNQQTHSNLE